MFRRSLAVLALILAMTIAYAQPYSVNLTVIAPIDGGAVDSYVLYLDGVAQGNVVEGVNVLTDFIPAQGVYSVEVGAVNIFGETRSDPVALLAIPPGTPSITITVIPPP